MRPTRDDMEFWGRDPGAWAKGFWDKNVGEPVSDLRVLLNDYFDALIEHIVSLDQAALDSAYENGKSDGYEEGHADGYEEGQDEW